MPYVSSKPPGTFTQLQAAEIIGISINTFRDWMTKELLPKPDVIGGGTRRYYRPEGLTKVIRAAKKLMNERDVKDLNDKPEPKSKDHHVALKKHRSGST